MKIFLEIKCPLKEYFKGQEKSEKIKLKISKGKSILDLINQYKIPKGFVSLISVNGKKEGLNYKIKEDDLIKLYPPTGGG